MCHSCPVDTFFMCHGIQRDFFIKTSVKNGTQFCATLRFFTHLSCATIVFLCHQYANSPNRLKSSRSTKKCRYLFFGFWSNYYLFFLMTHLSLSGLWIAVPLSFPYIPFPKQMWWNQRIQKHLFLLPHLTVPVRNLFIERIHLQLLV